MLSTTASEVIISKRIVRHLLIHYAAAKKAFSCVIPGKNLVTRRILYTVCVRRVKPFRQFRDNIEVL